MKIILLIVAVLLIYFNQNSYTDLEEIKSQDIQVEIKGAVKNPGVYKLKYQTITKDLIEKSGGFLDSADESTINVARKLHNEDVIVIENKTETKKVSINTANMEELCTLKGVGQATAQKIIDYRENVASFQQLEDLMMVKGIKNKLFDKLKEFISL